MLRAVIAAVLVTGLAACSSGRRSVGVGGGVYPPQQLGQFLQDTAPPRQGNDYLIGVGDRLDIAFFFNRELSQEDLLVRSDGRITLPYMGDVMAAGLTPMRLDTLLTNHFAEILKDPNLSVIVVETADPVVYVLGEVRNAGGYPINRAVSLLQALALAGGFKAGAKTDHVLVIRRKGLQGIVGVEVNAKAIIKGEQVQNDFILRDFDIVYVPKTRIQSIADFAQTLNDIVTPPTTLFLQGWQVRVLRQQLELFQNQSD
jgi:polysaccharide export outer membrane protein